MMYARRRLKAGSPFPALAIPLVVLAVFITFSLLIGVEAGYYAIAAAVLVYLVFTCIVYARTMAPSMVAIAIYQAMIMLVCILAPSEFRTNRGARPPSPAVLLALVLMLASQIAVGYLVITRRAKWRGRELLELAAQTVDIVEGGYTARPRPAGRAEYSRQELLDFASFVQKNLVALVYKEEQRVVFRPIMTWDPYDWCLCLRPDYADATWIAFDFEGSVTVSISRQDYLRFVEDLSFDQLCASLGQVFIEFLELFRQGRGVRVIDRLNTIPTGLFE